MAVNKIEIKTGVEMPPKPRRRSKYEAAHIALAEGPIGEGFDIELPDEWDIENTRLSLQEHAQSVLGGIRLKTRTRDEKTLWVLKEKAKAGKNGTKGKK